VSVVTAAAVEFGGAEQAKWEYVSAEAPRLLDIKEQLLKNAFRTQAEMAEYYGVSATQIANDRDKGTELGLWTRQWWNMKLRYGKTQRTKGATSSPVGDVDQLNEGQVVVDDAEPKYPSGPDGEIKF
jgi:hypothetical protein